MWFYNYKKLFVEKVAKDLTKHIYASGADQYIVCKTRVKFVANSGYLCSSLNKKKEHQSPCQVIL